MKTLKLPHIFGMVGLLLLIPLIAMQFSTEINWSIFDFVVMGCLLTVTLFGLRVVSRIQKTTKTKVILALAVLLLFLLVWGELAVGIFGSPWAGN